MAAAHHHGLQDSSFPHVQSANTLRRMELVPGDGEQIAADGFYIQRHLPAACTASVWK